MPKTNVTKNVSTSTESMDESLLQTSLAETVPVAPVRPASTPNLQQWFWIAVVGAALIAGLIGFIIGERVGAQTSRNVHGRTNMMNGFSRTGTDGGRMGPGSMTQSIRGSRGKVTAVSSTSITLMEQRNNSAVTYTIDTSTRVTKSDRTSGALADIRVGDEVMVRVDTTGTHASAQQVASMIIDLGSASTTSSDATSTQAVDPSTT